MARHAGTRLANNKSTPRPAVAAANVSGVARLDFIEQTGRHPRQRQRPGEAEDGANPHHRQRAAKHGPEDRRW